MADRPRRCALTGVRRVPTDPALAGGWLDPESLHAAGAALDMARRSLGLPEGADLVTRMVARKIFECARRGERDPQRLHDAVMRWMLPADQDGTGRARPMRPVLS